MLLINKEGDPKVNQIFKEITDCKFKEGYSVNVLQK